MSKFIDLDASVQINDGLTQTSGDGVSLAFDEKYGIMFCAYMPGPQGHYGESRGRISLSYFPASQPTNIRFIDITSGNDEYVPNIISLGDGKVRIFYEKDSKADGDHFICYKDFDYIAETLSEEKVVMLNIDSQTVPLTESQQFAYLEKHGHFNHTYAKTEQICMAGHTIFKGEDGYHYGAISSYLSEVILYRSSDNLQTVEFFATCPYVAQYEFDYKFLNGKIYAIYRTNKEINSISYTTSEDNGKTWSEPIEFADSIQCRPKVIIHNNHALMSYNYYNADTKNRPHIQQGRTSIRLCFAEDGNPNENTVCDIYYKYGIVNVFLVDILNDVYMGYSSSVLAIDYHNGTLDYYNDHSRIVRGKDAVRYIKLGDLSEKQGEN